MENLWRKVSDGLGSRGWSTGTIPVGRLIDLRGDLDPLLEQGLVHEAVRNAYLNDFKYEAPGQLQDARSLVVVAVPQPRMRIHFIHNGRDIPATVPPTYANAMTVIEGVRKELETLTVKEGGRFVKATLPLKTLAARTGLVRYGRNNITYLPGHGSFHRLVAYFSNLDFGMDQWQEREPLPACKTCDLCRKACPASVISKERFLIHVEKCLTFLNEMPSEKAFPVEVKGGWHNAIVGCMRCQDACPYDKKIRKWTEEGETFTEDETRYLLKGDFSDDGAKELSLKLERCGLDFTIFPRNLEVLL